MRLKRVSARKLKAFVREEKMASAEYRKLGFLTQARDEAKHSKFFKKILIQPSGKYPMVQWAKRKKVK